jgi:YbbR domain-containing protein
MLSSLKTWARHNWFLKVLALIIGVVAWVIASRWVYETITLTVPVELKAGEGMIVKAIEPPLVTVILEYPREAMTPVEAREIDLKIVHDLSGVDTPGTVVFNLEDGDVRRPPRFRVAGLNPSRITAELDRLGEKVLPVRVSYRGTPRRGYRVVESRVYPSEVKVTGPAGVLEGMSEIATVPITVMGRQVTFDAQVDLQPVSPFAPDPLPEVNVIVVMGRDLKERVFKKVRVDILRDSARFDQLRLEPREVDLYLKGPEPVMDGLTASALKVYVDIVGLEPGTWELPLHTAFPPEVVLERSDPPRVKVTLDRGPVSPRQP